MWGQCPMFACYLTPRISAADVSEPYLSQCTSGMRTVDPSGAGKGHFGRGLFTQRIFKVSNIFRPRLDSPCSILWSVYAKEAPDVLGDGVVNSGK